MIILLSLFFPIYSNFVKVNIIIIRNFELHKNDLLTEKINEKLDGKSNL